MHTTTRRALPALLFAFLLLPLSGCGGSDSEPAADAPATTEEPAEMEAPASVYSDEIAGLPTAMERGNAFLAANGAREGVTQTASGLQYEVVTQGEGEKPTAMSTVEVHYEGTLLDGSIFDSSYARGETIEFPLNQVISGWTEGVQLMPVGSKYRLFIPSALAYGTSGTPGGPIGPDETLIFTVELLNIVQ